MDSESRSPKWLEHLGDVFAQGFDVRLLAMNEDDEIVCVADDPPSRLAMDAAPAAQVCGRHRPTRPPRLMQVLIEHRQRDVGQQRRQNATLRRAGVGVLVLAEFGEDPGLKERLDQQQHTLVLHSEAHPVHQGRVIDRVEACFDIRIQHPAVTLGAVLVDLGDRVVCSPHGPKPVGDRHEVGLEDRFQHQLQRRLDDPVGDGGNAEFPQLPRPARFRNLAFPHRQRPERARLELGTQVVQEAGNPDLVFDVGDRKAVHAGRPGTGVARDPIERHDQRCRVVHEVEQVVEPAAGIGRRPTVKFGLHLRYPPTRTHRSIVGWSATVQWCIFRHYSLHPFSKLLPPFPLCTGFPRL